MKRADKKRLLLIIAAVAAALMLPAVSAFAAAAYTASFKPTAVYAGYANKAVYVEGGTNLGSCNSAMIVFDPAVTDPEKVFSLATAAFLSGHQIKCKVDGCDGYYQKGFQCALVP